MFQPLRDALAEQYAQFTAPRPRAVDGCQCCTTPRQLAALVSAPREQLTSAALDFYARKAMTTVGGAAEFRYYWPRLAELAVLGELFTDREIIFSKPHYGAHHTWPAEEQRALLQLATALGQWMSAEELDAAQVDEWVCAVGQLAEGLADVRPYLAPLLTETPAAWANLRRLVEANHERLRRKGRLSNAFWDNAPTSAATVIDWLNSELRVAAALRSLEIESAQLYGTPMPDEPTIVPPAG